MLRRWLPALLWLLACNKAEPSNASPDVDASLVDAPADVVSEVGNDGAPTLPSQFRVGIDPQDLTTKITSALVLFSDDGLTGSDTEAIQALEQSAELRTYPELALVPIDIHPALRSPSDPSTSDKLEVVPRSALEDRWYVLSAVPSAQSIFVEPSPDTRLRPFSARFRLGSAPVRRRVSICAKATSPRVIIEFSEGVDPTTAPSGVVVAEGRCTYVNGGPAPAQAVLYFDCDATIAITSVVRVAMNGTLATPDGVIAGVLDTASTTSDALIDTKARVDDFDFSAVLEGSGCRDIHGR